MFLDIIKSFFIENRIKKSLSNSPVVDTKSIETIGILIDISEKNYSLANREKRKSITCFNLSS